MKKIMTFLMIFQVAVAAHASYAPGQEDRYENGQTVTNASGTVVYRKSGKILPKEPVVVDVTNVLERGINVFIDDENKQKDDIYGVQIDHEIEKQLTSRIMLTTAGFQYMHKYDKVYTAFSNNGNISNTFFQHGTNITQNTSPKIELPTNSVVQGKTMLKQNGNDRFVSLNDVIIILKAFKDNKLTINEDNIQIQR